MIHSPRMAELPTTFGKYYLIERLAVGGMAEIFLAKLVGPGGFEKTLVIKQIHPSLSSQRAFVDLFVAEAKTLVSLSHGNIVPVYELGVVDDTYFIAMEYIDGPTLWRLTEAAAGRGEAIAPELAAYIAAEIAKGLDYAHRKGAGVIHRDLSPRNVMLTRDGEVKLVDFGIAVALGAGPDPADGGLPTGSLPYMAPEQARGEQLSAHTDLFALGVLTWEMVTGRRLFARADVDVTLAAVRAAEVPAPSTVRPSVPGRLEEIVLRALAREPDDRWANAGELAAALQRFQAEADALVGARELAALVARLTPPHASGDRTGPQTAIDVAPSVDDDPDDGAPPSTQVIPRSRPRGKRAPTVREATFATHVELERALGPVTPPMAGRDAARVDDGPITPAVAGRDAARVDDGPLIPAVAGRDAARLDDGPITPPVAARDGARVDDGPVTPATPAPAPPRPVGRRAWPLAIALTLAAAGAWFVWPRGQRAAAPPLDAAIVDAAPPDAPPADAAPPDAPVDAAPPVDAPARDVPRDPPRDAARAAAATGALRVGANPWGEVFLDGKPLGRAPNEWIVPAGRHAVEVVFPADDGERRRRFAVEVPVDDRAVIFADFTAQ